MNEIFGVLWKLLVNPLLGGVMRRRGREELGRENGVLHSSLLFLRSLTVFELFFVIGRCIEVSSGERAGDVEPKPSRFVSNLPLDGSHPLFVL